MAQANLYPGVYYGLRGMNWPKPKYTPGYKLAQAIIYPGILRPGAYSGLLHMVPVCLGRRPIRSNIAQYFEQQFTCQVLLQKGCFFRRQSTFLRTWTYIDKHHAVLHDNILHYGQNLMVVCGVAPLQKVGPCYMSVGQKLRCITA